MTDEERVLDEIETATRRIKDCASFAAAGLPIPTYLAEALVGICGATLEALAVAGNKTPRQTVEQWFKLSMTDAEWQPRREALAERGRRIIGTEDDTAA